MNWRYEVGVGGSQRSNKGSVKSGDRRRLQGWEWGHRNERVSGLVTVATSFNSSNTVSTLLLLKMARGSRVYFFFRFFYLKEGTSIEELS